ncbi:MAG: GNAT family N-acetyltransferase [Saprospiraceae bacterium]|nr:GNAT family N-acetyltransferase [Saprospiraceae bacterium]
MIRALGPEDLEAFIQIRSDSLCISPESFGSEPRTPEAFDRIATRKDLEAKNERNFILGYFQGEKLKGIIGFIQPERDKVRHRAFIWGVFVYPEYRGQGIGRALMESTLERAKGIEGLVKVVLSVTYSAEAAKRLYESFGFKTYGLERDAMRWNGKALDELFMEWYKPE